MRAGQLANYIEWNGQSSINCLQRYFRYSCLTKPEGFELLQ